MIAPRILITGFGPFPDMPVNASATLARRLANAARRRLHTASVNSCILPTEWIAAPKRLDAVYARYEPRIALHFGVTTRASGLEIERIAVNDCTPRPDAAGRLPISGVVSSSGPASLRASLPVAAIVERLTALGIPVSPSDDAGQYLCNAILYQSCTLASRRDGVMAGFIHVPAVLPAKAAAGHLTMDDAIRGGLAILDVCLAAMSSPVGATASMDAADTPRRAKRMVAR